MKHITMKLIQTDTKDEMLKRQNTEQKMQLLTETNNNLKRKEAAVKA